MQHMEMETRAADGTTHRTTSVRVCSLGERIVYKQTKLPKVLLGHSGSWHFAKAADGRGAITSRHLVMLDPRQVAPGGLARVPGPGRGDTEAQQPHRDGSGRPHSRAQLPDRHPRTLTHPAPDRVPLRSHAGLRRPGAVGWVSVGRVPSAESRRSGSTGGGPPTGSCWWGSVGGVVLVGVCRPVVLVGIRQQGRLVGGREDGRG